MENVLRTAILQACRHFMIPVARFFLRNGLTYREFSEVAKFAFVEVATNDYGLRGRPTNISRTAVITGLTRKEIRKIRDAINNGETGEQPKIGRPAQTLSLWHQHEDFVDSSGQPRELEVDGPASFRELARLAGGDVPPGALLTELFRAGAVEETREGRLRAVKRHFNPSGLDPYIATRFGECMHDLATTIVFNMDHPIESERRYEYRVWNDNVALKHTGQLQRMVRNHGSALLQMLDDWLAIHEHTDPETAVDDSCRCGLGLYYFEEAKEAM